MTEYDYSPDAVDRYYAKLNSVAKWVDNQHREAPGYRNPFMQTASEVGRSSNAFYAPKDRDHHRPGREREREREHYRTHASNASSATLVVAQPRHSSGSGSSTPHRSKSQPRSSDHTRRPHTSRSLSTSVPLRVAYDQQHPHPVRSHTLPPHYAHNQHQQQTQTQTQYAAAPGQTVVMKHGRQTYVVVPPQGGRVELRSQNTSPTYAGPAPAPVPAPIHTQTLYAQPKPNVVYAQPLSPTSAAAATAKKQPFLKRIFGGSSNANNANNVNGSSNYGYGYGAPRKGVDAHVVSPVGVAGVGVYGPAGQRRRTASMHY